MATMAFLGLTKLILILVLSRGRGSVDNATFRPFKAYYHTTADGGRASESIPFVTAMEECSLSAIMAGMANEFSTEPVRRLSSSDGGSRGDAAQPNPPSMSVGEDMPMDKKKDVKGLSTALKKGTAKSHKSAENVRFVRNFIRGKIPRHLYSRLLLSLYHVYSALEEELERYGPVHFPSLHRPTELARTASLERDNDFFHDPQWKKTHEPTQATKEYVERIRFIAQSEPILLLAHAYTRYLGDLSGGRVLQRVAKKALFQNNMSSDNVGLSFYDFENIGDHKAAKAFKDSYRRDLDALTLTERQIQRMTGEANVAFVLNMRVFEELDVMSGEVQGAVDRPLQEALVYREEGHIENDSTKKSGKSQCPFAGSGGPNPHKKSTTDVQSSKNDSALQNKNSGKNQLPFAAIGGPNPHKKSTTDTQSSSHGKVDNPSKKSGRCPWPFVFFHDPIQGMMDYQTWIFIGVLACFAYKWLLLEH